MCSRRPTRRTCVRISEGWTYVSFLRAPVMGYLCRKIHCNFSKTTFNGRHAAGQRANCKTLFYFSAPVAVRSPYFPPKAGKLSGLNLLNPRLRRIPGDQQRHSEPPYLIPHLSGPQRAVNVHFPSPSCDYTSGVLSIVRKNVKY